MLHRHDQLIPIKVGFLMNFLSCSKNLAKVPVLYIVHGLRLNFTKNEKERILHFYNFF